MVSDLQVTQPPDAEPDAGLAALPTLVDALLRRPTPTHMPQIIEDPAERAECKSERERVVDPPAEAFSEIFGWSTGDLPGPSNDYSPHEISAAESRLDDATTLADQER